MSIYVNLLTVSQAKEEGSKYPQQYHDDELLLFAKELKLVMKSYQTVSRNAETMWVFREGDSFCMGYIGFGNFMDKGDGVNRYAIFSPHIENCKYASGRRQNMKLSINLKQAVKACSALRPLNVEHVMRITGSNCARQRRKFVAEARDVVVADKRKMKDGLFALDADILRPNEIQEELRHLVDTGHTFLNPTLGEKLSSMFANISEVKATSKTEAQPMLFVEAISTFGKPKYRVAEGVNVDHLTTSWEYKEDYEEKVYSQEDIPEEISGKMAVLSMVEQGRYVAGVGYRATENIFFLKSV